MGKGSQRRSKSAGGYIWLNKELKKVFHTKSSSFLLSVLYFFVHRLKTHGEYFVPHSAYSYTTKIPQKQVWQKLAVRSHELYSLRASNSVLRRRSHPKSRGRKRRERIYSFLPLCASFRCFSSATGREGYLSFFPLLRAPEKNGECVCGIGREQGGSKDKR